MGKYLLECCVDSVESALAAAEGGADRLELCSALVIGGITPGVALFERIRERMDIPVRVLLRPRFGDFLYTEHEIAILMREVELFRKAGAEGIVIGCLDRDGGLDMPRMTMLKEAAGDMKVTLHRAFDVCADPEKAYRQAGELGIDTILTSGQAENCLKGIGLLKKLCGLREETGGPTLMAGAGVTPEIIGYLMERTDIRCYHMSAKKSLESGMRYRKEKVPMGLPGMNEYTVFRTDAEMVRQAKERLLGGESRL